MVQAKAARLLTLTPRQMGYALRSMHRDQAILTGLRAAALPSRDL